MKCDACVRDATHRCNYHLHPDDINDGVWTYHCPFHLCPHCEAMNASTH